MDRRNGAPGSGATTSRPDDAERAEVVIYTAMLCPFCHRAKRLLDEKGVAFTEIDVTLDRARRVEMSERAGGSTSVPQIFVGDRHIGDCDEIYALEHRGELDALLRSARRRS